jgi:hypothetical protein
MTTFRGETKALTNMGDGRWVEVYTTFPKASDGPPLELVNANVTVNGREMRCLGARGDGPPPYRRGARLILIVEPLE